MLHGKNILLGGSVLMLSAAIVATGFLIRAAPGSLGRAGAATRPQRREFVIPVDASLRNVAVIAVFSPKKRDPSYDQLERTGGQCYHLQPFELDKATDLMLASSDPNNDFILGGQGTFSGNAPRDMQLLDPSGRAVTPASVGPDSKVLDWLAGNAWIIRNPAPGNWKLTLQGSGRYSVRALGGTGGSAQGGMLIDFDFIKPAQGHEGWSYAPLEDLQPALGAEYIARVEVSEDAGSAPPPQLVLRSEEGEELSTWPLHTWQRGASADFGGVMTIPRVPFRIGVRGVGKDGYVYERYVEGIMEPAKKPSPYSAEEIRRFKANPDAEPAAPEVRS